MARWTNIVPMQSDAIFYAVEGPLDALPRDGQLRAANLRGFSEYVTKRKADPNRILERFGIDRRALADPDAHVSATSLVAMFEYCADLFGDSLFGLHLAQQQEPEVFGCVTTLCKAAPDVRTALEAMIKYVPVLHSPEAAPELLVGNGVAQLRWETTHDLGRNDQANLQAMVLQMRLLDRLCNPHFRPLHVDLTIDVTPREIALIEEEAGCRVRGSEPVSAIAFPAELLDLPVSTANRLVYRLLGGYLERVRQAERATLVEQVRDYIRGDLPRGRCSIENCATKLGLSVRTLQAKLSDEGRSFSQIIEETRFQLARSYLRRPENSLEEIAEWLGYGEQTSFGRAFKRWAGQTPQKYRSRL